MQSWRPVCAPNFRPPKSAATRAAVARWLDALLHHLRGPDNPLELPLDIRATAFQRKVWEHLREIPAGGTESYSQVAEAIGEPRAVRAVARACAANPVAVAIPCHRVVRSDGEMGGYRWGVERKESLLARERRKAKAAPAAPTSTVTTAPI